MDRDLISKDFWVLCSALSILSLEVSRNLNGTHTIQVRSSFSISNSSAANSTPVGPPPQTTNDNRFLRSWSVVLGRHALSKHSITLLLIFLASVIFFRYSTCSSPSTPWVLVCDPTPKFSFVPLELSPHRVSFRVTHQHQSPTYHTVNKTASPLHSAAFATPQPASRRSRQPQPWPSKSGHESYS